MDGGGIFIYEFLYIFFCFLCVENVVDGFASFFA